MTVSPVTSLAETSGFVMPSAALKFPDDASIGEESDFANESEESEATDDDSDVSEQDMRSSRASKSKTASAKSKGPKAAAKTRAGKKDAAAAKPKRKVKKDSKAKGKNRTVKSRISRKGDSQIFRYPAWRAVPDPCNIYYSFCDGFTVNPHHLCFCLIVRNSFPVSLLPLQYLQLAQLV